MYLSPQTSSSVSTIASLHCTSTPFAPLARAKEYLAIYSKTKSNEYVT